MSQSQESEIILEINNYLDKNKKSEIIEKDRTLSIDSLQYSEESKILPIDDEILFEELIPSISKNNELDNSLNYSLFLEKPLDEVESISSIEDTNISKDILIESSLRPSKKIKLNKCKGCYMIFQSNQEGHIGEYGCLGDYYDFLKN